jgi:hypothetical protein
MPSVIPLIVVYFVRHFLYQMKCPRISVFCVSQGVNLNSFEREMVRVKG